MLHAIKRRTWVVAGIVVLVAPAVLALRLAGGDGSEGQAATVTVQLPTVQASTDSGRAPGRGPARVKRRSPSAQLTAGLPAGASAVLYVRDHQSVKLLTDKDGGSVVAKLKTHTAFGSRTTIAVVQVKGDWAQVMTPDVPNGEYAWVKLDPRRLGYYVTYSRIDVNLSTRRATLFIAGKPKRSFSISIGAPGTDTPTGLFAVTDTFTGLQSPWYGCCALALTADQPNLASGWMGGNRIAIHGSYDPLGEAISHGCVHAANPEVRYLVAHVPIGSRVEIHN
jgi:lipoprotein-anchoring transpeptidase ErfK/SrfK